MNYIELVDDALSYVESGLSQLNEKAKNIDGMSSIKVRNFLNRIVSNDNIYYLEIGVWKGSTFYSAIYGNKPKYALAIDNFSQFSGSEDTFLKNLEDVGVNFSFINSDCFDLKDKDKPNTKFNVYFYDGDHSSYSQKMALTYYADFLQDEFVYVCDDWNWPEVKAGTFEALETLGFNILKDWELPANFNGDKDNWWNGLWVAVIKKYR